MRRPTSLGVLDQGQLPACKFACSTIATQTDRMVNKIVPVFIRSGTPFCRYAFLLAGCNALGDGIRPVALQGSPAEVS